MAAMVEMRQAWQAWKVCPGVRPIFKKLCQYPAFIEDVALKILEKFVITMYDKHSATGKVDGAGLHLFAWKQRSYDAIPLTSATIFQQAKRSPCKLLLYVALKWVSNQKIAEKLFKTTLNGGHL